MISIAVVDDDFRILAQLGDIFGRYFVGEEYELTEYTNGMEFVDSLQSLHYDVVFMDIEMEKMDGKEAVKRLRKHDLKESVFVVYISSHTDNLVELFAVHPFEFLVKPIKEEQIFFVLDKIVKQIRKEDIFIPLTVQRGKRNVSVNDIMYIESVGHNLKIALSNQEELICYMKLGQLETLLHERSSQFVRVHASFLVNKTYITMYTQKSIYLSNTEIPVSLKFRNQVISQLREEV